VNSCNWALGGISHDMVLGFAARAGAIRKKVEAVVPENLMPKQSAYTRIDRCEKMN